MMLPLTLITILVANAIGVNSVQPFNRQEFHIIRDYFNDVYKYVGASPIDTPNKKWFNTRKGSYGYVAYDTSKNNIAVAFRGTVDITNMAQNLRLKLVSYAKCAGCRVHQGFMDTYNSAKNQVLDAIRGFHNSHPTAKVYVTGYSLGGAQAVYCAADLYKAGIQANLMTFGSPRPGNYKFSRYLNSLVTGLNYRITYQGDKISILPPLVMGFLNVGTEVNFKKSYFRKRYQYKIYPQFHDFTNIFRGYNLLDHNRANYKNLE